MKLHKINRLPNSSNYNRGQHFEYCVSKHFLPEKPFSLDNIPFWVSADIPELGYNCKLVNKCSLTESMQGMDLETFTNWYIGLDKATTYMVGFDLVGIDSPVYIALEMNPIEFKDFLLKYGKEERNGNDWKCRITLANRNGQEKALHKMGFSQGRTRRQARKA